MVVVRSKISRFSPSTVLERYENCRRGERAEENCRISFQFHTILAWFSTFWPDRTVLTWDKRLYNPVPHVFDSEFDPLLIGKRDTPNIHIFFRDLVGVIEKLYSNLEPLFFAIIIPLWKLLKKLYNLCLGQTLITMIKSIKK